MMMLPNYLVGSSSGSGPVSRSWSWSESGSVSGSRSRSASRSRSGPQSEHGPRSISRSTKKWQTKKTDDSFYYACDGYADGGVIANRHPEEALEEFLNDRTAEDFKALKPGDVIEINQYRDSGHYEFVDDEKVFYLDWCGIVEIEITKEMLEDYL